MQVGDLVRIKDPTDSFIKSMMPSWMIEAQKSHIPLLIVAKKPAVENPVSAQVQVLCDAQLRWAWAGALEELSEKCK